MIAANAVLALIYLSQGETIGRSIPRAPSWIAPLYALGALANVVSAIAVWTWRRWGVYTFCAVAVLILVGNLSAGISPLSAILGLAGPVILVLLVRSRWDTLK